MKNKIFLYSLTSLVATTFSLAYAHPSQDVEAPVLKGGFTASVGTFYVTPTSDYQDFSNSIPPSGSNGAPITVQNVNPDYEFGIDASLGYIFEKTARSVELFFRNISTSDSGSAQFPNHQPPGEFNTYGNLKYDLDSFDLMFSQFVNLGQVMQVRFSGGLAYVDLSRSEDATGYLVESATVEPQRIYQAKSKFRGWGPRIGVDTRYVVSSDIKGLGIVGGGSMAYYQGDLDINSNFQQDSNPQAHIEDNPGNHAVLNFRANLGLDYVYSFNNEARSTLGLEIGYLIDFYDDGAAITDIESIMTTSEGSVSPNRTTSVSFAGPYLNLIGAF